MREIVGDITKTINGIAALEIMASMDSVNHVFEINRDRRRGFRRASCDIGSSCKVAHDARVHTYPLLAMATNLAVAGGAKRVFNDGAPHDRFTPVKGKEYQTVRFQSLSLHHFILVVKPDASGHDNSKTESGSNRQFLGESIGILPGRASGTQQVG